MSARKLLGDEKIDPSTLDILRTRGGTWAAYQNQVFDASGLGHLKFLQIGPTCTYQQAPEQMPDSATEINWKYLFVGWVDLPSGEILDKLKEEG